MADKTDGRPRHQQIAADLRAAIMRGDYPVGEKLPKLADLCDQFGVSLRTIQDATQVLKDEGLIEGERGQGVFVRTRPPHVVDVSAYVVPSANGYKYKLLQVAEVQPPGDVAEAFGIPHDSVVVLRKRLTHFDGKPLEVDWSYYPVEIARGTDLERNRLIRGGSPRVLAEAGLPERDFMDEVTARPPTTEEVILLGLPDSVQVIQQFRIVYSDDSRPVEVSLLSKPSHLYQLRYRQKVS